mgnify:CR=1 FL=1
MMISHDLQLYDHLLRFQLFQGLSRSELLQLAGNTKFGFATVKAGQVVVKEDMVCTQLFFLISGTMQQRRRSDDGGYTLTEQLESPWLLQPEALFGAQPRHTTHCVTLGPCQFIVLSKDEVMRLLDDFLIIRLNFLNLLATRAQQGVRWTWRSVPTSLSERFLRFLLAHCVYPAGPKQLSILMTRLAEELSDSRLNVSRMLNGLQDQQLLHLRRGNIDIPSLERLLQISASACGTFKK